MAPQSAELPEFDRLMNLYWGGEERRITGITIRIIGVNALALIILMLGIVYLSQYQNNLISARLETFERELDLISTTLSEKVQQDQSLEQNEELVFELAKVLGQHLEIYDQNQNLVLNTRTFKNAKEIEQKRLSNQKHELQTVAMLKSAGRFLLSLLPDSRELPQYPYSNSVNESDIPDALKGLISISVWHNENESVFLSAAAPIGRDGSILGAIHVAREATEIEEDFTRVWTDIIRIFVGTLILTILLSIYLSGLIAYPLKKLAKATEAVRKGQAKAEDIPDFSNRHDEIGELSTALRQMTLALWERMDATERFAADVAHELKNPLTSMRSAVETAAIVKKDADRKKLMDIIQHDVERLDRLITDISNASRIDAELSKEAFQKINLKNMLHNLLDMYATNPLERQDDKNQKWNKTVQTKNCKIILSTNEKANISIWGLEGRLSQVFQNLISNAGSFTPENGTISVYVETFKKQVRIRIEDEGPGIPENKIEAIFDRFYSERPESEEYGRHSGLGLSICRQIIEAHGGQIYAENIKDTKGLSKGARFNVLLNCA